MDAMSARLPRQGTGADGEAAQHNHEHDASGGAGSIEVHSGGGSSADAAAAAAESQRASSPQELEEVEQKVLCHEVRSDADGGKLEWRFGAAAVAPLGLAFDRLKRNLCLEQRCFLRLHETIAKQVRRCAAFDLAAAELLCVITS